TAGAFGSGPVLATMPSAGLRFESLPSIGKTVKTPAWGSWIPMNDAPAEVIPLVVGVATKYLPVIVSPPAPSLVSSSSVPLPALERQATNTSVSPSGGAMSEPTTATGSGSIAYTVGVANGAGSPALNDVRSSPEPA